MRFQFAIQLTDEEYFAINKFLMLQSRNGKKKMLIFRISLAVALCAIAFLSLLGGGFTAAAWRGIIPYFILLALFQAGIRPFFLWIIKGNIRSLGKQGKMPYSPTSDMTFGEESFTETTPDNKTEVKYTAIDNVSAIPDQAIYIHINSLLHYIIPVSVFASRQEYEDFLSFLETKCEKVERY